MKIKREQIDHASDGELCELARINGAPNVTAVDPAAVFDLLNAAGLRGWQIVYFHRAGLGEESVAALQPEAGGQARIHVRTARPELCVFRAYLYATACEEVAPLWTKAPSEKPAPQPDPTPELCPE